MCTKTIFKVTEYPDATTNWNSKDNKGITHYYESPRAASNALIGFYAKGKCNMCNGKVTPIELEDKKVPATEGIIVKVECCHDKNKNDSLIYTGTLKVVSDHRKLFEHFLTICNGEFRRIINGNEGQFESFKISKYLEKEDERVATIGLSTIMPIYVEEEGKPYFYCFFSADLLNLEKFLNRADSVYYKIHNILVETWASLIGNYTVPVLCTEERQDEEQSKLVSVAPLVIKAVFTEEPSITTFRGIESIDVVYDTRKPTEDQMGTAIVHVGAGPVDYVVDLPKINDSYFPFHFNALGNIYFFFKTSDAYSKFSSSVRKHVAIHEYFFYKDHMKKELKQE